MRPWRWPVGLTSLAAVVDPDPDPAADQQLSAAAGRPYLKLPRGGENRATDLRSFRIFVERDAILHAIIGSRSAGDQSPAGATGGGQIRTQSVRSWLTVPRGGVKRLAIGSRSHPLRIAEGGRGGAAGIRRTIDLPGRRSRSRALRSGRGWRQGVGRLKRGRCRHFRCRLGGLLGKWFGRSGRWQFFRRRPRLRWIFRPLRGLQADRLWRLLRNLACLEVRHGDLFLRDRALPGAECEQQEQEKPLNQEGQADGERAAPSPSGKPLGDGCSYIGAGLKQRVFVGISASQVPEARQGISGRPTQDKPARRRGSPVNLAPSAPA